MQNANDEYNKNEDNMGLYRKVSVRQLLLRRE